MLAFRRPCIRVFLVLVVQGFQHLLACDHCWVRLEGIIQVLRHKYQVRSVVLIRKSKQPLSSVLILRCIVFLRWIIIRFFFFCAILLLLFQHGFKKLDLVGTHCSCDDVNRHQFPDLGRLAAVLGHANAFVRHDVIQDIVGQFQNLSCLHEIRQNLLASCRSSNDQVTHLPHKVVRRNVEAVVVDEDLLRFPKF